MREPLYEAVLRLELADEGTGELLAARFPIHYLLTADWQSVVVSRWVLDWIIQVGGPQVVGELVEIDVATARWLIDQHRIIAKENQE